MFRRSLHGFSNHVALSEPSSGSMPGGANRPLRVEPAARAWNGWDRFGWSRVLRFTKLDVNSRERAQPVRGLCPQRPWSVGLHDVKNATFNSDDCETPGKWEADNARRRVRSIPEFA